MEDEAENKSGCPAITRYTYNNNTAEREQPERTSSYPHHSQSPPPPTPTTKHSSTLVHRSLSPNPYNLKSLHERAAINNMDDDENDSPSLGCNFFPYGTVSPSKRKREREIGKSIQPALNVDHSAHNSY